MAQKISAGLILGGSRKEDSFLTVMKYFAKNRRWFVLGCHPLKEDQSQSSDEKLIHWVRHYGLTSLTVDFPLSPPLCHDCELDCPGEKKCPVDQVVRIRSMMDQLLNEDISLQDDNPKKYEQKRQQDDLSYLQAPLEKATDEHLLSRFFKRRLKKGFLPYWNRPIDFWIWRNYFDPVYQIFKTSYDSFGSTSLMLVKRFDYLKRHLPKKLKFYESHWTLCLLEILRADLLNRKHLKNLMDIDQAPLARIDIIKAIEEKCELFYYEKDFEFFIRNPKAFESFLLALADRYRLQDRVYDLPSWSGADQCSFFVPKFLAELK